MIYQLYLCASNIISKLLLFQLQDYTIYNIISKILLFQLHDHEYKIYNILFLKYCCSNYRNTIYILINIIKHDLDTIAYFYTNNVNNLETVINHFKFKYSNIPLLILFWLKYI